MTFQKRFIEQVGAIVQKVQCDLVHDRQWANTGTLRVMQKGKFKSLFSLDYNFQDSYFTLRGSAELYADYSEDERIEEFLKFLENKLRIIKRTGN